MNTSISSKTGWAMVGLVLFLAVGYWFNSASKKQVHNPFGSDLQSHADTLLPIEPQSGTVNEVQAESWVGVFQAPFDWIKAQGFKLGIEVRPGNSIFVLGVDQDGNVTRAISVPIKGTGGDLSFSFGQEGTSGNGGGFTGQLSVQPNQGVTAIYLDGAGKASRGYSYSIRTGVATFAINLNPVGPNVPDPLIAQNRLLKEQSRMLGSLGVMPWKTPEFRPDLFDTHAYLKGQQTRWWLSDSKIDQAVIDKFVLEAKTPVVSNTSRLGKMTLGEKINLGEINPKVYGLTSLRSGKGMLLRDLTEKSLSSLPTVIPARDMSTKAISPPDRQGIEPFGSTLPKHETLSMGPLSRPATKSDRQSIDPFGSTLPKHETLSTIPLSRPATKDESLLQPSSDPSIGPPPSDVLLPK